MVGRSSYQAGCDALAQVAEGYTSVSWTPVSMSYVFTEPPAAVRADHWRTTVGT